MPRRRRRRAQGMARRPLHRAVRTSLREKARPAATRPAGGARRVARRGPAHGASVCRGAGGAGVPADLPRHRPPAAALRIRSHARRPTPASGAPRAHASDFCGPDRTGRPRGWGAGQGRIGVRQSMAKAVPEGGQRLTPDGVTHMKVADPHGGVKSAVARLGSGSPLSRASRVPRAARFPDRESSRFPGPFNRAPMRSSSPAVFPRAVLRRERAPRGAAAARRAIVARRLRNGSRRAGSLRAASIY